MKINHDIGAGVRFDFMNMGCTDPGHLFIRSENMGTFPHLISRSNLYRTVVKPTDIL